MGLQVIPAFKARAQICKIGLLLKRYAMPNIYDYITNPRLLFDAWRSLPHDLKAEFSPDQQRILSALESPQTTSALAHELGLSTDALKRARARANQKILKIIRLQSQSLHPAFRTTRHWKENAHELVTPALLDQLGSDQRLAVEELLLKRQTQSPFALNNAIATMRNAMLRELLLLPGISDHLTLEQMEALQQRLSGKRSTDTQISNRRKLSDSGRKNYYDAIKTLQTRVPAA
jgi:hypothetical protein